MRRHSVAHVAATTLAAALAATPMLLLLNSPFVPPQSPEARRMIYFGLVMLGIRIPSAILSWLCCTYSVSEEGVRVRRGVLFREEGFTAWPDVATFQSSQPLMFRFFRLWRLDFGTGAHHKERVTLVAVGHTERMRITELARLSGSGGVSSQDELSNPASDSPTRVFRMTPRDYPLLMWTHGQFLVVIGLAVSGYLELQEVIPLPQLGPDVLRHMLQDARAPFWLVLGAVTALACGVALSGVKYKGLQVVKNGAHLYVSGGLLTHEDRVINTTQQWTVRVDVNPMMAVARRARVSIGGKERGSGVTGNVLLPVVRPKDAEAMLDGLVPPYVDGLKWTTIRGLRAVTVIVIAVLALWAWLMLDHPMAQAMPSIRALFAVAFLVVLDRSWCRIDVLPDNRILIGRGMVWRTTYVVPMVELYEVRRTAMCQGRLMTCLTVVFHDGRRRAFTEILTPRGSGLALLAQLQSTSAAASSERSASVNIRGI